MKHLVVMITAMAFLGTASLAFGRDANRDTFYQAWGEQLSKMKPKKEEAKSKSEFVKEVSAKAKKKAK